MATVRGTNGDDLDLTGTNSRDVIFGYGGDDGLSGLKEKDYLYGGAGNDLINGGADSDRLFGGARNDTFVFAASSGNDTIYDFVPSEDALEFQGFDNVAAVIQTSGGLQFNFDGDSLLLIGVNEVSDIHIIDTLMA